MKKSAMKNISTKKSSNTKWIWVIALSIVVAGMIYYNQVNVQNAPPSEGSVSDSGVASEGSNECPTMVPGDPCEYSCHGEGEGFEFVTVDTQNPTKAIEAATASCDKKREVCVNKQKNKVKIMKETCERKKNCIFEDMYGGHSENSKFDCRVIYVASIFNIYRDAKQRLPINNQVTRAVNGWEFVMPISSTGSAPIDPPLSKYADSKLDNGNNVVCTIKSPAQTLSVHWYGFCDPL